MPRVRQHVRGLAFRVAQAFLSKARVKALVRALPGRGGEVAVLCDEVRLHLRRREDGRLRFYIAGFVRETVERIHERLRGFKFQGILVSFSTA